MEQVKRKRKRGDRKDAYQVKDCPALLRLLPHILPNRTDCEVYISQKIDVTKLMEYIRKKNAEHPNYKTTIFHCLVVAMARVLKERHYMNRFIQGRRIYERFEISLSFMAKRRFADGADEAMMIVKPKDEDTLDTISHRIYGDVTQMRKKEHAEDGDGIDGTIEKVMRMPTIFVMALVKIVRILDFWGKNPDVFTDGDINYTSVLFSNLGSIGCPSVYHHLNNYGTNSVVITLGTVHKENKIMPDGSIQLRDIVDFGATIDERIGDGFYFARSLKLVEYICEHPEILDKPLGENSGFEYK